MSDRARIAVGGRSNSTGGGSGGGSVAHDITDVQACSNTNHSQNNPHAQSSSRRGQTTFSLFPHTYTYIYLPPGPLSPLPRPFRFHKSKKVKKPQHRQRIKEEEDLIFQIEMKPAASQGAYIVSYHITSYHDISHRIISHRTTSCTRVEYTMHQSKR